MLSPSKMRCTSRRTQRNVDDLITLLINHADKIGHIGSLPAMLAGAGIAWNVSRMMGRIDKSLNRLSMRIAHVEGHLGIGSSDSDSE